MGKLLVSDELWEVKAKRSSCRASTLELLLHTTEGARETLRPSA
jgi:hypothetical protein